MNNTLDTIYNLRTIHGNFSKKDVPEDEVELILDACVQAANASARQSYSILVINDRKVIKEKLAYSGSKALLFCVDYNRVIKSAEYLEKEFKPDGIISFITGSTDTILAAQTAAIAAKSLGIDSMFTNSIHRCDIDEIYEAFHLPKRYCYPLIALILGYAETEPVYQKGRLNGKGLVHYETYKECNQKDLREINADYNNIEKHLGLIDNWEDKGFANYLDWFFSSWCRGENLDKQKEVTSLLQRIGFIVKE